MMGSGKTSVGQLLSKYLNSTFYDLDDSVIYETELRKGDVIVLFRGGHSLEVLEENTIFYEMKNNSWRGDRLKTFGDPVVN